MQRINAVLNRYNMYIQMRAYLGGLILLAAGLSFLGLLPYSGLNILLVSAYLVAVSLASNWILARIFHADTNISSPLITALILTLIVGPLSLASDWAILGLLATIAIASKYFIAWQAKHIFNPAAFAVVIGAVVFGQGASWWVGTPGFLPLEMLGEWVRIPVLLLLVILGGILIARKIHRWQLIAVFIVSYLLFSVIAALLNGMALSIPGIVQNILLYSPLFFFAFVMLVEPATSPEKMRSQMYYGIFIAALIVILQYGVGIAYAFELSLLGGNLLTRLVEPSKRYRLALKSVTQEAKNTKSFHFKKPRNFHYKPGQFMVWTLPHKHTDSRGNRRWFTVSSSPTEEDIMITMRFADSSSSFKQALKKLEPGDKITATGPSGEFTLPGDTSRPLVWITGGIGITPFRSMVQYLYDKREKRSITLFYGNRTEDEIAFKDTLDKNASAIGMKTVYTLTETAPDDWPHEHGFIDADMIKRHAPDYQKALFYLSGPQPMVEALEKMLRDTGLGREQIKTDYFPGYDE